MSTPVLSVRDKEGNIIPIPAIKGDKGDSYTLTEADKEEIAGIVATEVETDMAEVLASLNSYAESLIGGDS